ncbi:MAG TPA: Fe-Mn family superoxide dismutase [Candidatus Baltobacteraceae bacterium]|nr:Fe-Mn family superoxide dismutase [Candidatus Baltobacteraceae bacterium]
MNAQVATKQYTPKKWDLSGLQGISDDTLQIHFGLYEGYVKNTNLLNERLTELRSGGKNSGADPAFAELVRRLGWEFNGMRLHEYYFDNLTKNPKAAPGGGRLYELAGMSFGSFENWRKDFAAIGAMRGVGWAIAFQDQNANQLVNIWIGDHNINELAGCEPVIVMDLWEHAFLRDYKPADKGKYIEAFLAHVDWGVCESRLTA